MADLKDIYDFILKPGPQGGIYQPGPPVMMPPQGMGQQRSGVDPIGPGAPSWNQIQDFAASLSRPQQTIANTIPGPTPYPKYQDRMPSGNALAFNGPTVPGLPQPPALAAIDRAMPPMPRPRPVTPGFSGPITQPNWDLPGMDTGMNGLNGPPTRNPPAMPGMLPAPPTQASGSLRPSLPGILGLLQQVPGKSQPTAYQQSPAGMNPAIHAQLMAQQRPNNPEAYAAQKAGKSYYIERDGSMSPTKTIGGKDRRL